MQLRFLLSAALLALALCQTSYAEPVEPAVSLADYYAEPKNLPFDELTLEEGHESGWHWREFLYTSLVYDGESIRVHAVYAVPDQATSAHKVPLIVATHGKFGISRKAEGGDPRYWKAITDFVTSGYAVFFFDWEPTYAIKAKSAPSPEPQRFTTFGKLDYSKEWRLAGNDWKDGLFYQAMMAGRRGMSWATAQPEVDASHIGAWGASFGGIFSSLLAAIDPRISAANPVVYTAGFGLQEESYNRLPKEWTESQVTSWRARFDSELLLQQRTLPMLYTVSTNDQAFSVMKAMRCFEKMNKPKHLVIAPNEGHGYWQFDQTLAFFNHYLLGKGERPEVGTLTLKESDKKIVATVNTTGTEVALYYSTEAPKDATLPEKKIGLPSNWVWTKMDSTRETDKSFKGEALLPEASGPHKAHVFARVTFPGKVIESIPIATVELSAQNQ